MEIRVTEVDNDFVELRFKFTDASYSYELDLLEAELMREKLADAVRVLDKWIENY